jgi:vacuolar-type H+-ATPase subunit I/STV1
VSKHGSKERIGQSIDGILGNLTIRGRDGHKDKDVEELHKKVLAYESLGSLEDLKQQKEDLLKSISDLEDELSRLQDSVRNTAESIEAIPSVDRDKNAYQPSPIISQYCEQPEGKRKLTIHLREIEYQAILKASQHFHSSKGQIMDTITKALRFYIPTDYYVEAEREVSLKAVYAVRGVLEQLGFSQDEIELKLKQQ